MNLRNKILRSIAVTVLIVGNIEMNSFALSTLSGSSTTGVLYSLFAIALISTLYVYREYINNPIISAVIRVIGIADMALWLAVIIAGFTNSLELGFLMVGCAVVNPILHLGILHTSFGIPKRSKVWN